MRLMELTGEGSYSSTGTHLQLGKLCVHIDGRFEPVAFLPLVELRQLCARVPHLVQVVHTNNTVREASCRHIKPVNSATCWQLLWVSVMLRGETHFCRDAYVYANSKGRTI